MRFGLSASAASRLAAVFLFSVPLSAAAQDVYLSLEVDRPVIRDGERVQLSWATSGAKRCRGWWGVEEWRREQPLDGARFFAPAEPTDFTLKCRGNGGSATRTVHVDVVRTDDRVDRTEGPQLNFSASRTVLTPGETAHIGWDSWAAKSCTASGAWDGDMARRGHRKVAPGSSTTYTLTCVSAHGRISRSIAFTVGGTPADDSPAEPETPEAPTGAAPTLTLSASPGTIEPGASTLLQWASSSARSCSASGAWGGSKRTSGKRWFSPDGTRSYTLTCENDHGETTRSVTVAVALPTEPAQPEPAPEPEPAPVAPTVSLQAAAGVVDHGASTELQWRSSDADQCTAGGDWTGGKSARGNEAIGPIERSSTFSLTCTGAGGNAVAMVSVAVNNQLTLSWQAPSRNEDGSRLADLAGYRIYYGTDSGSYTHSVDVEPGVTSRSLALESGDYYFVMTALDAAGNESLFSNEVVRTVL